jgi:isopentenyl-diphosphate delta-isomerase
VGSIPIIRPKHKYIKRDLYLEVSLFWYDKSMSKEQVSVVDENDNVVATKARDDLTRKDIIRISVLWIENDNGQVLLQQRALTKKIGPGQWGPAVAGTVDSHETYLSNIVKEAEEEINLTDFTPIEVAKKLYWEPDGRFGRMFMFYKTVTNKNIDDFTIQEDEVAQLRWVDKDFILKDIKQNTRQYVPSAVFWKEMYY